MDIDHNIICLAKRTHKPKLDPYCLCIIKCSKLILLVVQLKVFHINYTYEQEGLYNKVNNIAKTTDTLVVCLPIQANRIL
jgi:hypothetical protein